MSKALLLSLSIVTCIYSTGQTILLDEDFSNGIPSTWAVIDADGNIPHASMSQFTAGWIAYNESQDTTAASTSYYENSTDQSEDYLILPKLSLATFTKLSWSAHSVDPSFADGYYVLLSTTDSLPTSYSDTLLTVLTENYNWNRKSIMLDTMGFANQDVYIAFRNFTTNGFILELDDILVEASDFASQEERIEPTLGLYPNPAKASVNIQIPGDVNVNVLNMDGKTVLSSNDKQISTVDLVPGQYMVQVLTASGVYNEILIIE